MVKQLLYAIEDDDKIKMTSYRNKDHRRLALLIALRDLKDQRWVEAKMHSRNQCLRRARMNDGDANYNFPFFV